MAKIFEVERKPGEEIVFRLRPPLKSLSPEVREHFIKAQKELLLSFRGFLDAAIEVLEAHEQGKPSGSKRTKIEVK